MYYVISFKTKRIHARGRHHPVFVEYSHSRNASFYTYTSIAGPLESCNEANIAPPYTAPIPIGTSSGGPPLL